MVDVNTKFNFFLNINNSSKSQLESIVKQDRSASQLALDESKYSVKRSVHSTLMSVRDPGASTNWFSLPNRDLMKV